jgi:hypothetical protein
MKRVAYSELIKMCPYLPERDNCGDYASEQGYLARDPDFMLVLHEEGELLKADFNAYPFSENNVEGWPTMYDIVKFARTLKKAGKLSIEFDIHVDFCFPLCNAKMSMVGLKEDVLAVLNKFQPVE